MFFGGNDKKKPSVTFLRGQYASILGDAFSDVSRRQKCFFEALSLWYLEKSEQALKKFERVEQWCSTNQEHFAVLFFKAKCYSDMKCVVAAISEYKKALTFTPHSTAYSNLGLCYLNQGDFEQAIVNYQNAINADPQNPYPYNNLAQLYVQRGEYEIALECAEKAISLKYNIYQAWSAKAVCFAMMGNEEAFKKAYRQAVAFGSKGEKIRDFISSLKNDGWEDNEDFDEEEWE